MSTLSFTQPLRRVLLAEAFEPTLAWGIRMALASVAPVLWGTLTGHGEAAGWMALTAQAICWVELKSGFGGRFRILLGGILLALFATALGSLAGRNIFFSVACMFGIGTLAGLFKNLGDRGAGLSVSLQVLFIVAVAYPVHDVGHWAQRLQWVAIGGGWNAVIGMAAVILSGERSPARRAVALIWRAAGEVFNTVARGWSGTDSRAGLRTLYEKEKAVRAALDVALTLHAPAENGTASDPLTDLRRHAGLTGALAASAGEALASLRRHELSAPHRKRLGLLLQRLGALCHTLGLATATLRTPDDVLEQAIGEVQDELSALQSATFLTQEARLRRALQLAERSLRLASNTRMLLQKLGSELPFYRSPSVLRLGLALHPRHWRSGVRLLLSPNSATVRYALRIGAASALAMAIYQIFNIPRGYWLPLTVIVVAQPYFGATLTKARDRVLGTVIGGLLGGVLLLIPTGLFVREAALAVCAIGMVYYLRRRYSVATVFITVTLVLVLSVSEEASWQLLVIRALSTVAGAVLAIAAGFLLLPTWDRTGLPQQMAAAFCGVYSYFTATFYGTEAGSWTVAKRRAERATAAAFDALNRYLTEPGATRRVAGAQFGTLARLVRITHEINAFQLVAEEKPERSTGTAKMFEEEVREGLRRFNKTFFLLRERGQLSEQQPLPLTAEIKRAPGPDAAVTLEHIHDELRALETELGEQKLAEFKAVGTSAAA